MGCLCSTDSSFHLSLPKRTASAISASSSFAKDLGDISLKKYEKNFYSDYSLEKEIIGCGARGEIRLCIKKSSCEVFAVKIINKAQMPSEVTKKNLIRKQIKMLSVLDHPSILKIQDFYEDHSNYFILMDYLKQGDLYKAMEKIQYFSEPIAARVMKQIFSALAHMHSKGIAHRDIKPENIIIEEKSRNINIKIIDFDTSVNFEGRKLTDKQGSIYYMSPEVIRKEYNEKCDVWSAGVILFAMLTNSFPFYAETEAETENLILEGKLDIEYLTQEGISQEAIHFLTKILNKNEKKRFTAEEASHHGWILKYSYENLLQADN